MADKAKAIIPRKIVNLETVQQLAASGLSRKGIAKALHFNRSMFDDRPDIREAAETGEAQLEGELVARLLEKVRNGDLIATIFACKSLAGLTETPRKEAETDVETIKVYLPDNRRNSG